MTTINEIVDELNKKGYLATATAVTKNGVSLQGINMRRNPEQKICPVVYVDDLLSNKELLASDIADILDRQIEGKESIDIGDINRLFDRDYIFNHCFIAMQKLSQQSLVKRVSSLDENIEEYIYLKDSEDDYTRWTIKLPIEILLKANIDIEDLWKSAEQNTYAKEELQLSSLRDMLSNLCDTEYMPDFGGMPDVYVITNKTMLYGSSQIQNPAIREWAIQRGFSKLICIPASLHEVLVIPADEEEISLDELEIMIQEVNSSTVSREEQLGNKPIIVNI